MLDLPGNSTSIHSFHQSTWIQNGREADNGICSAVSGLFHPGENTSKEGSDIRMVFGCLRCDDGWKTCTRALCRNYMWRCWKRNLWSKDEAVLWDPTDALQGSASPTSVDSDSKGRVKTFCLL